LKTAEKSENVPAFPGQAESALHLLPSAYSGELVNTAVENGMLSLFPDSVVATNNALLCPNSTPVRGWSANRNLGLVSDKIAF
jgi:hypothetical protein